MAQGRPDVAGADIKTYLRKCAQSQDGEDKRYGNVFMFMRFDVPRPTRVGVGREQGDLFERSSVLVRTPVLPTKRIVLRRTLYGYNMASQ